MKTFKAIISIILALLMAFTTAVNCISAEGKQYIKEIRIGYGDDGKSALKDAGYTVWEELNANEGANGGDVWFGYITTENKEEAITDLAVMNMNGGYSISAYSEKLTELKKNVEKKKNQFLTAVEEFSANYRNGSEYAKAAAKLLDYFYYDGDDAGEEKITLTELFTAETIDENKLFNIMLEGNSELLDIVYNAITLGLTETKGNTVLDRLKTAKYVGKKVSNKTQVISDFIPSLKVELLKSETINEEANAFEGGVEAYIESRKNECGSLELQYYLYLYKMANETPFGNTGLTLFEVMSLPLDEPEIEDEEEEKPEEGEEATPEFTYIDDYLIDMLARSLTSGQVSAIACVGLESILENAYAMNDGSVSTDSVYKSNLDYINEELDKIKKDTTVTSLSVFSGVDRSLFENSDDIALTTAAIRADNKNKTCDLGKDSSQSWFYSRKGRDVLGALSGASAAISLGVGAVAMNKYFRAPKELTNVYEYSIPGYTLEEIRMFEDINDAKASLYNECAKHFKSEADVNAMYNSAIIQERHVYYVDNNSFREYSAKLVTGLSVVSAVIMAASIALAICAIVSAKKQPVEKDIEYKVIPRAIVDVVTDENEDEQYIPYYAAKQITATDSETDYLKLYADLNGFNKKDEWLVLYASYDSRLGEPLTPEMITGDNTDIIKGKDGVYSAIHDFGYTAAKNLNYYSKTDGAKAVYVYLKSSAESITVEKIITGSLFNIENAVIAASALALGALISFAITFGVLKKKKKTAIQ